MSTLLGHGKLHAGDDALYDRTLGKGIPHQYSTTDKPIQHKAFMNFLSKEAESINYFMDILVEKSFVSAHVATDMLATQLANRLSKSYKPSSDYHHDRVMIARNSCGGRYPASRLNLQAMCLYRD